MSASTASDRRYFEALQRGPVEWTGPGTSVTPILDGRGEIVMYRAYDGVHETWTGDHEYAVLSSRQRAE